MIPKHSERRTACLIDHSSMAGIDQEESDILLVAQYFNCKRGEKETALCYYIFIVTMYIFTAHTAYCWCLKYPIY